MHIKSVRIQGFKSYKDQGEIEPFSNKHNVIVGRNGSGKSNFFFAIRFVLGEVFGTSMRTEDRQSLLHEGVGPASPSAYVEIIFDNSDGRIPVERNEVVVRRSVSLKKDEYFIDGKHSTKVDVQNLLESAGLSRSNPYYIVQQGKVDTLTIMKDKERLELLMEVAGTRTYDDRRAESLRIMDDTEGKRKKIGEVISIFNERLSDLEGEKEELKSFQLLDKKRRVLEFTHYDQQLKDTRSRLETLEEERQEQLEKTGELHGQIEECDDKAAEMEKVASRQTVFAEAMRKELEVLIDEKREMVSKRSKVEMEMEDVREESTSMEKIDAKQRKNASSIEKEIEKAESDLNRAKDEFAEARREEQEIRENMSALEDELIFLRNAKGDGKSFSSVAERDSWIKQEIKQLKKRENECASRRKSAEALVQQATRELDKQTASLENMERLLSEKKKDQTKLKEELSTLYKEREALGQRRKSLWQKDAELTARSGQVKSDVQRLEGKLSSGIPRNVSVGIYAVQRIVKEKGIDGYFGPLIDLISCDSAYFTAVDVVGGNSLFNLVVKDDATASEILRHMNAEHNGRVTFMPLNRLNPPPTRAPANKDAVPLIEKIRFDTVYTLAVRQIFGKAIVCRDLDTASSIARSEGLNCVTLDGDEISRRGALTGGYREKGFSRMQVMMQLKDLRKSLEELQAEGQSVRADIELTEAKITGAISSIQRTNAEILHLQDFQEQTVREIDALSREKELKQKKLESLEESLTTLTRSSEDLIRRIQQHEREIGQPLKEGIAAITSRIETLEKEATTLAENLRAASDRRSVAQTEMGRIQERLRSNLYPTHDRVRRRIEVSRSAESTVTSTFLNEEFESLGVKLLEVNERIASLESRIEEAENQARNSKTQSDDIRAERMKLELQLQDFGKALEALLSKRSILLSKRDDALRHIRSLGTLPSEGYEEYRGLRSTALMKHLHSVNEELKKFSHVNKKAIDQYMTFSEQRDELQRRQKELEDSAASINDMISVLDSRKDAAIERTFKGVAKNFKEVFAKLVPGGFGSLVMLSNEDNTASVRRYSGVAVRVSFSTGTEPQLMQQLSGGQKAMVALALIFAIQKCDPAPFYLFDEVDSNLDAAHRTAVAQLIKEIADGDEQAPQFITTTFRPELVQLADKHYGVQFHNKMSSISVIHLEDAQRLIDESSAETDGDHE